MSEDLTERMRRLVAERRKMRGMDTEIYAANVGHEREASLDEADLLALCDRIANQQEAIDELVDCLTEARIDLWNALDHLEPTRDPDEAHTIKAIDALLSKHGERT